MEKEDKCLICQAQSAKYNCPRCNIIYCSVNCYRSPTHLECSEQFYRECIEEDLKSNGSNGTYCKDDIRKVYEILQRIRETEAGHGFEPGSSESLDSDDDDKEECTDKHTGTKEYAEAISDDEGNDLCERLKNIDINDANQVWNQLTANEKKEFETLLASGDIMKLVPSFTPWWLSSNSKQLIEDLHDKKKLPPSAACTTVVPPLSMPAIATNITKFSDLCRKEPAPNVHYNLWNILASYACTVRFFTGEHYTMPNEASACLINLSACLKYGTNFENVEEALSSVEIEAKTTGQGAVKQLLSHNSKKAFVATMPSGTLNSTLVEDHNELVSDVRRLMLRSTYKLAALSDILNLFRLAKKSLKQTLRQSSCQANDQKDNPLAFHKLFALNGGGEELTNSHLCLLIKKIYFYLSYVNRNS